MIFGGKYRQYLLDILGCFESFHEWHKNNDKTNSLSAVEGRYE